MSLLRSALVPASLLLLSLSGGCTPRCQESCAKVLDCDLGSTRVARDECVLSCQLQQTLYQDWEDKSKIKAFRKHKRCIRSSTCEEIAEGACYDETLFLFEDESPVE